MERFTIDLNGPLHGMDYGGEGRLVLLVHGLGGSATNWAAVGEDLTRYGHVIAPDLPGFGRTPPAGRTAAVGDQADHIARLIERFSDRPALVVGNSMGGLITMLTAARYPRLVDRLVLVNPAAPSLSPKTISRLWALMMALYLVPGVGEAVVNAIQRRGTAASRTSESMDMISAGPGRVSNHLKNLHSDVALERESMPWAASAYLSAYRSIIRRFLPLSRYDAVARRIQAPTLLIHGTEDTIVPIAASERLAAVCPAWTYVRLDDTGHIPMLECPERFLEVVEEFVGSRVER
jgi:pimeloyl-ACP methyl ester carboxylesterase